MYALTTGLVADRAAARRDVAQLVGHVVDGQHYHLANGTVYHREATLDHLPAWTAIPLPVPVRQLSRLEWLFSVDDVPLVAWTEDGRLQLLRAGTMNPVRPLHDQTQPIIQLHSDRGQRTSTTALYQDGSVITLHWTAGLRATSLPPPPEPLRTITGHYEQCSLHAVTELAGIGRSGTPYVLYCESGEQDERSGEREDDEWTSEDDDESTDGQRRSWYIMAPGPSTPTLPLRQLEMVDSRVSHSAQRRVWCQDRDGRWHTPLGHALTTITPYSRLLWLTARHYSQGAGFFFLAPSGTIYREDGLELLWFADTGTGTAEPVTLTVRDARWYSYVSGDAELPCAIPDSDRTWLQPSRAHSIITLYLTDGRVQRARLFPRGAFGILQEAVRGWPGAGTEEGDG